MKTSNLASYDKIFETTVNTAISPDHRALLVISDFAGELLITNFDGTVGSLFFDGPTMTIVSLRIKKYDFSGSVFYVYGLR